MFMLKKRPMWGFLVGFASVGIPTFALVLYTDARDVGVAWLIALGMALIGGGWASLLAVQKESMDVRRAARLGAYAWIAVTVVLSILTFWFNPFVVLALPISALSGAGMGAAVGWMLQLGSQR